MAISVGLLLIIFHLELFAIFLTPLNIIDNSIVVDDKFSIKKQEIRSK